MGDARLITVLVALLWALAPGLGGCPADDDNGDDTAGDDDTGDDDAGDDDSGDDDTLDGSACDTPCKLTEIETFRDLYEIRLACYQNCGGNQTCYNECDDEMWPDYFGAQETFETCAMACGYCLSVYLPCLDDCGVAAGCTEQCDAVLRACEPWDWTCLDGCDAGEADCDEQCEGDRLCGLECQIGEYTCSLDCLD